MVPVPLPQQLAELSSLLGRMCAAAAEALQRATAALLEDRVRLAEQVVAGDADIDALRARVEEVATDALLFHAPVAGDLRAVVSAIRAAGDIERMGDLALHVADVVRMRHPAPAVPAEVRDDFAEMGRLAVQLALKAAEVTRTRNVLLAVELDADDDAMDARHRRMFAVLMDPAWPHDVRSAVDITLLARYYERFADHAVVVARETVYAVTGQEPDAIPI
ncbi:phosphate signaling complex protein PhoU [Pseudonocardia nigra]|uniref:phosphate signaling complex protein PhoU n=1 Tax=Pseudonocardia nigra TaxID=1921578 RepID=UPI001C6024FB|nr:phosphate signaling complex protein PhoU [Pseudonocardia nigra]